MTPALKRRWLRFSLRTLFVVLTVAACCLGWIVNQLIWLNARRAAIAEIRHPGDWYKYADSELPETRSPWQIRLMGGGAIVKIIAPNRTESELKRLRGLFPEAEVTDVGD